MAYVTKSHSDATGVVNMDIGIAGTASNGIIIATGLTKHPTAYRIVGQSTFVGQQGVGGAVETILKTLQTTGTVVMYQIDATALSVLMESQGFANDTVATAAITAIGNRSANVSSPVTSFDFGNVTLSSSLGFKISAS